MTDAPAPVEYLELEDLLGFTRLLRIGPVRDIGLLDGCAARPRATAFGLDAYPDLAQKAGALLHAIARTHPLVDGNKRLAWLATVVFLDLNGHHPHLSDDEAFALVMDVAAADVDVSTLGLRLRIRANCEGG